MSSNFVDSLMVEGVRIFTINRPQKRNAINIEILNALTDQIARESLNDDCRAIIIYGGLKWFSAGADLNETQALRNLADCERYFNYWHRLTRLMESSPKPIIAAIEGYCYTGGLELALAADVRIAGEGASFAITSSKIGTVAGAGGTQRLPRILGLSNALSLLLAAEPINVAEALAIGLIAQRSARGSALDDAITLGKLYALRAPLALAKVKQAVRRGIEMSFDSALGYEAALAGEVYMTADRREGISAFLEKRKPHFVGS